MTWTTDKKTRRDLGARGRPAPPPRGRNAKMLLDHRPDLVIAFPGQTGTRDCLSQARAMKISVYEPKIPGDLYE